MGKILVGSLCAYEIAALCTKRIPTITKLCHTLRDRHPAGAGVVWVALGILGHHLLLEKNKKI